MSFPVYFAINKNREFYNPKTEAFQHDVICLDTMLDWARARQLDKDIIIISTNETYKERALRLIKSNYPFNRGLNSVDETTIKNFKKK